MADKKIKPANPETSAAAKSDKADAPAERTTARTTSRRSSNRTTQRTTQRHASN